MGDILLLHVYIAFDRILFPRKHLFEPVVQKAVEPGQIVGAVGPAYVVIIRMYIYGHLVLELKIAPRTREPVVIVLDLSG